MQGFARGVLALFVTLFLAAPAYSQDSMTQMHQERSAEQFIRQMENAEIVEQGDAGETDNAADSENFSEEEEFNPDEEEWGSEEEEMGILVNDIVLEGNRVIQTEDLKKIVEPFLGQSLSLREMGELTDLITVTYQEKGYILARAYLPEQEIADGILKIAIAEGNVGKLKVVGEKYYSPEVIKRYFVPQKEYGVIQEDLLEEGIVLTSRMPDVKTGIVLKESETPGATDIILNASENPSLTMGVDLGADYNNYGSETIGEDRYGVNLQLTEHALGSRFSFMGSTGNVYDTSHVYSFAWTVPVLYSGSNLTVNYFDGSTYLEEDYSQYAPELKAVPSDSSIMSYGIRFSHPLVKKRSTSLNLAFGWEYKLFKAFVTAPGFSFNDKIDERENWFVQLGFENTDRFLGRNFFNFGYTGGSLTPQDTRSSVTADHILHTRTGGNNQGSDTQYGKITFQLGRIQKVYGSVNLMLRATGQYSERTLTSTEQFGIGGFWTVRGHPISAELGDSGYTTTAELFFGPPYIGDKYIKGQRINQMVQFNLFYDHGGVFINDPMDTNETTSEFLSSYGAGLRFSYKKFSFKYTFGVPVDQRDEAESAYHYFETAFDIF